MSRRPPSRWFRSRRTTASASARPIPLLPSTSVPDLIAEFYRNQQVWLSRLATGMVSYPSAHANLARFGEVAAVRTGSTGVIMTPATAPDSPRALAAHNDARVWLRDHQTSGILAWAIAPNIDLDIELQAQGYQPSFRPDWMSRDLTAPLPEADTTDIVLMRGQDVEHLPHTAIPYIMRDQLNATWMLTQDQLHLVYWLTAIRNDRPIGQAIVNIAGETAGLFNVAVDPGMRRHGAGFALTVAAMRIARDAGATVMSLNATPQGMPLYVRAGFGLIGHGQTWYLPGDRSRDVPSRDIVARARAIALGDERAIAGSNPNEPLANAQSPLQFAAAFRQADVARALLSAGAKPDIIALWDCGLRDAALAAVQDPAARSRLTGTQRATPLHWAVERGAGTLVMALIDAGVELNVRDAEHWSTPLGWARTLNKPTIAAILRRAGAE